MAVSLSLRALMLHTSSFDQPPSADGAAAATNNARANTCSGTITTPSSSSGHRISPLNRALPPLPMGIEPELKIPQPTLHKVIHIPQRSLHGTSDTTTTMMPSLSSSDRVPNLEFASPPSHRHLSFLTLFKDPGLFGRLLDYLKWPDFFALTLTCRECRDIFSSVQLKDAILVRFVPGYRYCRFNCHLREIQDVHVTLHDLNLFVLSQTFPIQRYPIHAVALLHSSFPNHGHEQQTSRLVALTQAQSRFILKLQSLIHSSSSPISPEPEEAQWKSRLSRLSLRELEFPAPLSYTAPHERHSNDTVLSGRSSQSSSTSSNVLPEFQPPPSSFDTIPNRSKTFQKRSIFGNTLKPPPPPLSEPRALKVYSRSWRRTSVCDSTLDDEWGVAKPLKSHHRRFSSSQNLTCPISSFSTPSQDTLTSSSSPYDLRLATSRTRAPILRVFVPCLELSDSCSSLRACEDQLFESGLWNHLSTGDVICNLGYVPPSLSPSDEAAFLDDEDLDSNDGDQEQKAGRKWLIFNGIHLVPYVPPDPPPLEDPLSLPSPFYYVHIMPPFVNPRYILQRLPPCSVLSQPILTYVSTKVRSPHSPSGLAVVKKYVWVVRVRREDFVWDGIGAGWQAEWFLEVEGTEEGRLILLDCLRTYGHQVREWELVRERSGGGRLWLKLLT